MPRFEASLYGFPMDRRISHVPLEEELARFQSQIHGLAIELARSIFRVEFQHRIEDLKASLTSPPKHYRRTKRKASVTPVPGSEVAAPVPVQPNAKRGWTRDAIINELASFLASGTTIDASFVNRYGPRGLVAATKREFGRFDAALNVASLRVAQLYPDKTSSGI
ncbi:MAG: hypothetical protein ABJE66_26335 [Deltaproteobacteria bacterium]